MILTDPPPVGKFLMIYNHYIPVTYSTIFLALHLFFKPVLHFLNESFIDSPKLIIWSQFWNIQTTFDAFPNNSKFKNWVGKFMIFSLNTPCQNVLGKFLICLDPPAPCWEMFPSFISWFITMASLSLWTKGQKAGHPSN